jgi:MFS family permease
MLKPGVTIGCAAAMVAALILAVRLRHTRRTPSPLSGSEPFGERLAVNVGRTGGMLIGAFISGLLTIGAGGRLMMRVLAATSSDDVQGLRTEADQIIGKVSAGGSAFLIVVVGIGAAVVGLALFTTLRRWLPDRSLAAGLIGAAIGAGLLVRPLGLLSSDNSDFTLVAPVGLAVGLCLAMLVLFGATFGVLVDRLGPRWPRPGWSFKGIMSVLPFAVLLLAPQLFVATVIGVLGGTLASRVRSPAEQNHSVRPDVEGAGTRFGRVLVMALGVVGSLSIVVAAGQVLAL